MDPAPYRDDLTDGPPARSGFVLAEDGVRIRLTLWPGGDRGTVLILPGRCEYAEKYAEVAGRLLAAGYSAAAIDWRGQGMSDRLLKNPFIGHVRRFADYQLDLRAMLKVLKRETLDRRLYLLSHSMGGCIALRTLTGAHPFRAAVFSAPMWGIVIAPNMRHAAHVLPAVARRVGLGARRTPTTGRHSFFLDTPFEGNLLTTDRRQWDRMAAQAIAEPQFQLGGPSLTWLAESLVETRALAALPRPSLPAYAAVGTEDEIVIRDTVPAIMEGWESGSVEIFEGAQHELLMERPEVRDAFFTRALDLFGAN